MASEIGKKLKSRRNLTAQPADHLDYRRELASIVVAVLHSGVATKWVTALRIGRW